MEPIPRRNPARFVAAVSVALVLVLAIATAYLLSQFVTATPRDPRVDELRANYRAHGAEFRVIARLASVDATLGIDVVGGSLGSNDITSDELPDYPELLRALEVVGAEHVSASDHSLDVITSSEGLAVSGRESGYYYTTSSDMETVTLEVARSLDAPRMWLYPLGEGWYASDYRF